MQARQFRNVLPMLYGVAVVLAILFARGKVLVAVLVVGAMVVGIGYAAMSGFGGPSPDPERAARRARRRNRS
jgi:hypothetical protein